MRYSSTRGGVKGCTFEEALLSGYTSDGGLLMPEVIPKVTQDTMRSWAKLTYSDLLYEIARLYISEKEIPNEDLKGLLSKALSNFTHLDVVTLKRLSNDLNVLELFHGKTLAFKDLALSCVGQFLEYFLEKRKQHITIVVGTSGDTGSAAIESVRGLRWVDLVVLLPRGRCSRIQELQMTTAIDDNIHVFRADGTSDDIDLVIKPCFLDSEFAARHHLCSINSINWARILAQIAHFFYAYFQVCPNCDQTVEIVTPTGACGNVTGGCIAVEMGLPVQLVCTVNSNDIVARTLNDRDFSVNTQITQTLAPSMDIQIPYNMERLLYLYTGGDTTLVCQLQQKFESKGKISLPAELHQKMCQVLSSHRVDDPGIHQTMSRCWRENEYLLCPHSATAVYYHYAQQDKAKSTSERCPRVCVATASPAKFEEAVKSAGLTPQPTPAISALDTMATKYVDMEVGQDWEHILRTTIEKIYVNKK